MIPGGSVRRPLHAGYECLRSDRDSAGQRVAAAAVDGSALRRHSFPGAGGGNTVGARKVKKSHILRKYIFLLFGNTLEKWNYISSIKLDKILGMKSYHHVLYILVQIVLINFIT